MRAWLHVPVGIACAALALVSQVLPLVFCLAFIAYELNEDRHIKDQAWRDLSGFLWGIAAGSVAMAAAHLFP